MVPFNIWCDKYLSHKQCQFYVSVDPSSFNIQRAQVGQTANGEGYRAQEMVVFKVPVISCEWSGMRICYDGLQGRQGMHIAELLRQNAIELVVVQIQFTQVGNRGDHGRERTSQVVVAEINGYMRGVSNGFL